MCRATIAGGTTARSRTMNGAYAALVFVPGLAIGSFLNVVAARVPGARLDRRAALELPGLRTPRSPGTTTSRSLSFLLLRGRCRACGDPIAVKYPLVELDDRASSISACVLEFGLTRERRHLGRLLRDRSSR